MKDLQVFTEWFKPEFDSYLSDLIDLSISMSRSDTYQTAIVQVATLASGGKSIRPYLIDLTIRQYGNEINKNDYKKLLFAMELFHLFALIHDDVFDKADVRRGIDCIHTVMEQSGFSRHIANSLAILIGDIVLSYADRSIAAINNQYVTNQYYKMVDELVYGEFLDVAMVEQSSVSKQLINDKTDFKSARYTFVQPVLLGLSYLKTNQPEIILPLQKIGIAFQIQDDYLDIVSDELVTGKPGMQDLQEGQQTFFTNYLVEHQTKYYRDWVRENRGKQLSEQEKIMAKKIFTDSGAISAGKKYYEDLYTTGLNEFERAISQSENVILSAWSELIAALITRTK
tara:strand:+ start:370 stop:1392 length:1023 start_codon:yes stop_codon:yes gene_type:complete